MNPSYIKDGFNLNETKIAAASVPVHIEDEVKGCLLEIYSLASMPRETGRGRAAVARGGFREEGGGVQPPSTINTFF